MPTARTFIGALLPALLLMATSCGQTAPPQATALGTVRTELPKLGHRNWIVIADSAYPWQSRDGIETVVASEDQLQTVKAVLDAVDQTRHVRPIIYLDSELPHVPEADATGVTFYRDQLDKLLDKRTVQSLPHEQIIAKLDEAAKVFHILIVKTNMTIPYTSVFLQLDCAYWGPEAEKRLRDAVK
jgi:hypothetical protein